MKAPTLARLEIQLEASLLAKLKALAEKHDLSVAQITRTALRLAAETLEKK